MRAQITGFNNLKLKHIARLTILLRLKGYKYNVTKQPINGYQITWSKK